MVARNNPILRRFACVLEYPANIAAANGPGLAVLPHSAIGRNVARARADVTSGHAMRPARMARLHMTTELKRVSIGRIADVASLNLGTSMNTTRRVSPSLLWQAHLSPDKGVEVPLRRNATLACPADGRQRALHLLGAFISSAA